jgi:hypothetical protein
MKVTGNNAVRDKESLFADALHRRLDQALSQKFSVHRGKSLLYKLQVDVSGELRPKHKDLQSPKRGQYAFQTDILIGAITPAIPLVVIELKFGGFSTHDVITYSYKAVRHKEIYPYLPYGFVVGGSASLSKKFLTHNQGIDFAMCVIDLQSDGAALTELVERQIADAKRLLELMRNDRRTFKRFENNVASEGICA